MKLSVTKILSHATLVFIDFDGVIKDSVEIKTQAYASLFAQFGDKVVKQVIEHHNVNGGVSRYKKIPYYFSKFVGKRLDSKSIKYYCNIYSDKVVEKVIDSNWIPGVEKYLRENPFDQKFILITGTPQNEIESILDSLKLSSIFSNIFGAPEEKDNVIRLELLNNIIARDRMVVIGDSLTDYEAARKNDVIFIYRGDLNDTLSDYHPEYIINDFLNF